MALRFSLTHSANKEGTVILCQHTRVYVCSCVQDVSFPRNIHFFISSLLCAFWSPLAQKRFGRDVGNQGRRYSGDADSRLGCPFQNYQPGNTCLPMSNNILLHACNPRPE